MGRLFWNLVRSLAGWKINGFDLNSIPKAIVVVAPHTSAWDIIVGFFTRGSKGFDIKFMGKHTLFKPPFGFLFKWLGGVPVDRTQHSNLVDVIAAYFETNKVFRIAIAPEGTRQKVDKLKTGFYYMAKKAQVPIVMVTFDYEHKTVTFSEPFMPSDDIEKDMAKVWNYFKGVKGFYPELGIA
ncbi:MAG: 1-acyl-sn-glycerol-3-phosphate acyltransferase [Saprospiraceae bacterium]